MITLHINVDKASPAQLGRALQYLVRTKQRTVQVAAGAELQKGMDFVDGVRAALPHIKVFWRNMNPEDTGIHAVKSPQWIFDNKVKPWLAWFKRNDIIFVFDNESSGDDNQIRYYVKCTVEFLVLMHSVNLATAVCRFATGNIAERQYVLLKPIFSAMLPSDWISPNEYSNEPHKSSGGHLARYEQMWIAAGKPLPTFIGEAGLCPDYDPGKGFRSVNMTGKAHAQQMIKEEIWYPGVDRALFVVGGFGWGDFQLITEIGGGKVEADTLDELEAHYAANPVVEIPTPTPPTPPPVDDWAVGIAQTGLEGVIIRFQPTQDSKVLAVIKNGDPIGYSRGGAVNGWIRVRKGDVTGYASEQFLKVIAGELPAPNPNPVPTPIPPAPPQSEIDLRKVASNAEAIKDKMAEINALQAEIDLIMTKWIPAAA